MRFGGGLGLLLLISAFLVFPPAGASASNDGPDFDQYVTIKFVDGASPSERSAARRDVDADFKLSLAGPLLQQVSVPQGESAEAAASSLAGDPNVEYAVASGEWGADADPYFNDSFLPKQWALDNYGQVFMSRLVNGAFQNVSGTSGADISAPEAWAQIDAESPDFGDETIGIVDTGVAYEHPDLAANMVEGRDFYDNDDDPRDVNGHGTHVASVAAGVAGDGIGTAGVDPWAKVMPLRAADEYGTFSWAAIEQAVAYGLSQGVRVFNGSFGGPDNDPAFEDIMRGNPQALFVFSAGNGGSDQVGDNHDLANGSGRRYPCDTQLDNVICVGASDWNDAISRFSDFGVDSVDLLAPGSSIYAAKPCTTPAPDEQSTTECPYNANDPFAPVGLGGGPFAFQLLSGTSMAAPAVAGAVALLWQKCPSLQASQVKSAIVKNVDPLSAVATKVAYGGRLNVAASVASISPCPDASDGTDWPDPPAQPTDPGGDGGGSTGNTGSTGSPQPPVTDPPRGGTRSNGLTFQIIRPSLAKVGRSNKVKFKLKCSDVCAAAITAQPAASGLVFKKFKASLARSRKAGTRTVSIKIPAGALKSVRALLNGRTKVRLKLSVIVTDKSGAASKPVNFSVKLARR